MKALDFFSRFGISCFLGLKKHFEIIRKMDYPKRDIFLYIDSPVEYFYRLKSCFHEPDTVKWIEDNLKENEVFFDIGANIGAYSLIGAKQNDGTNKIYSFEPNFASYNKLCKNILLNKNENQICPINIALSKDHGIALFNYCDEEVGSAYHGLEGDIHSSTIPIYRQYTLVYALDEFIEVFGLEYPHHIKIDVDGGELNILKGANKTIAHPHFKSLIVEIDENAKNYEEMMRYIKNLNLVFQKKYTDPNADDPEDGNYKIFNYVYTR